MQYKNKYDNARWSLSIRIFVFTKKQLFDLNLANI